MSKKKVLVDTNVISNIHKYNYKIKGWKEDNYFDLFFTTIENRNILVIDEVREEIFAHPTESGEKEFFYQDEDTVRNHIVNSLLNPKFVELTALGKENSKDYWCRECGDIHIILKEVIMSLKHSDNKEAVDKREKAVFSSRMLNRNQQFREDIASGRSGVLNKDKEKKISDFFDLRSKGIDYIDFIFSVKKVFKRKSSRKQQVDIILLILTVKHKDIICCTEDDNLIDIFILLEQSDRVIRTRKLFEYFS